MHVETYPVTLLQETKSLASHPLTKNPQSLVGQKENENEREGKNRARLCIFYILIYLYYILLYLLQWMQGNIYREVFPTFLAKKSYGWWMTRRRMEIIQKYLKKNIQSVGRKYREALRTISQVKPRSARFRRHTKRAAKSLHSKRLISQRCEVGFQLAVFGFQCVANIGKLQEEFHSTVQNGCEIISQQKADFAAVQKSSFSLE